NVKKPAGGRALHSSLDSRPLLCPFLWTAWVECTMRGKTMPRKTKSAREYRFKIDAYSPHTIPLARLSQYLSDLARMMGETANVHLSRVDKGSTVHVICVDWEEAPK